MNIKQLIKENYEIAKSKGFYPEDSKIEDHLMGIVSELGEAYEAHRGGKFADYSDYSIGDLVSDMTNNTSLKETAINVFMCDIKDSFEDELADVFIRLFNLCGHTGKDIIICSVSGVDYSDISTVLLIVNRFVISRSVSNVYNILVNFCIFHNIPIEKHIQAKMEYNKTREHLHGKQY